MKLRTPILICVITTLSLIVSPSSSSAVRKNRDVIINVVGDVHGESAIKREVVPTLKKYLADGNLNIFNLETAVTDSDEKVEKIYNFKTDLAFLKSLRAVGFNVASVANNHSYDYGEQGFLDTLQALDKAGIRYVGGGVNEDIAYQGQVFTIKGIRIGILGIAKVNGGPESIAGKERPGTTNGYDLASIENAITAIKKVSDVVIVLVHWGEEGSFCPRPAELASARKWQSLGVDIIVGSHTHTLQPITFAKNQLVAYSLGNFIFYSSRLENRSTGLLKIRISPTKRITYELQPFVINNLTKIPAPSKSLLAGTYCPD